MAVQTDNIIDPTLEGQTDNIIDPTLEVTDPTPNVQELCDQFNRRFFWGVLENRVKVIWSGRTSTAAGYCFYKPATVTCTIKLSAALLSLRPRKDLVNTLLHEMIHAYLFITQSDWNSNYAHGAEFHSHMYRINAQASTNITVYHYFLEELEYRSRHAWKCNGPCQNESPNFGVVTSDSDRPPGPKDMWWQSHQKKCNGNFVKIKGETGGQNGTQNWQPTVPGGSTKSSLVGNEKVDCPVCGESLLAAEVDLHMDECLTTFALIEEQGELGIIPERSFDNIDQKGDFTASNVLTNGNFDCPVCRKPVPAVDVNSHIDDCLNAVPMVDEQELFGIVPETLTVQERSANVIDQQGDGLRIDNVNCPVCMKPLSDAELFSHFDDCLGAVALVDEQKKQVPGNCAVQDNVFLQQGDMFAAGKVFGSENVDCPFCRMPVPAAELNFHVNGCLEVVT